jgi:23S rRNA (uracil1939-C5)-methyltransferase
MKRRPPKTRVPQVSLLRPGRDQRLSSPSSAESVLVHIEKPVYNGAFLGRDEGKAIFVPFALPGEQVRARILEDKRSYANAELVEVVTPSPQRLVPRCPHFGPCGGCHYQHTSHESQLVFKQSVLRETLQRAGVTPPETIDTLAGLPWEYRNRVRLAFDPHGNPAYRGRRSHSFVAIRECPITAPILVKAAFAVADVVRSFSPTLQPTEMALFTNAHETAVLLSLFLARPTKIRFDALASALKSRIPQLAGAELLLESREHEFPKTIAQWGEPSLIYRAADVDFRVDHGAFFQVNRGLVDALVERVTAGYKGALAWDLFAGVGLFARSLAGSFSEVIAVESAPAAARALAANLEGTAGVAVSASTLSFLRENRRGPRPDLIVVDPPRTGLGPDITTLIGEIRPPALVYVSCDPATLARDLRALLDGGYLFDSVTLADLFPQTFHLETVARLRLP